MPRVRQPSSRRRVRIVAPSSPFPLARLERGVLRLEAAGFSVEDVTGVLVGHHAYLNGTDDERRRLLEDALRADVDLVWIARGGYGLTRILSALDVPDEIPVVVGFSDATALHGLLWQQGLRSVHGPLATSLADEPDEAFEHLLRAVEARAAGAVLGGLRVLIPGPEVLEGRLFAANLCVLAHLVGTRAMPDLTGALLVLEEVGERPYRIDRMLTQLLTSGALDGVHAVLLGHLTGCTEPPGGEREVPAAIDVVRERLSARGVPLVAGLPVGHEAPNFALPSGARARLTLAGEAAALEFLEDVA
jgi:muramoyltetrapeptide carboxypeptidase